MFDPVTITAVTAATGAAKAGLDFAAGAPPMIHAESGRRHLKKFMKLSTKAKVGTLTPIETQEIRRLYETIQCHALMIQNAPLLEYLEKEMKSVEAHSLLDELANELGSDLLLPNLQKTPSLASSSTASLSQVSTADSMLPPSYSRDTTGPLQEVLVDIKPQAVGNENVTKSDQKLKQSASWFLVVTAAPVALFAPQVRRNLFTSGKST